MYYVISSVVQRDDKNQFSGSLDPRGHPDDSVDERVGGFAQSSLRRDSDGGERVAPVHQERQAQRSSGVHVPN